MIVDTGPFVAAANRDDRDHDACRRIFSETRELLHVPAMVVAEATFMIERSGGPLAEAAFLRSLRSPRYIIEAPTSDDLRRAAELVERYADLRLGGTDASVIALAERLATARSSHWTAATSLSFRHPPPQASPFFRRDLRQRSRRPLRSRRSQSNSRIIGEMVTIGERPVSAIIGFCPLAATSFCPTDGHPTGEREVLTERECPRPPRIWSRPPAHITPNAGSAR